MKALSWQRADHEMMFMNESWLFLSAVPLCGFGLSIQPCPCFQEASQGWESLPHLRAAGLHCHAWINNVGGVQMLCLFASALLWCVSTGDVQGPAGCLFRGWTQYRVFSLLLPTTTWCTGQPCLNSLTGTFSILHLSRFVLSAPDDWNRRITTFCTPTLI